MSKIKIKPCEGFRVKKPNGDFLKDSGELVERGTYWGRRIKFGEVEICDDSKKEEPKKKKEIKKEKKAVAPKPEKEGE